MADDEARANLVDIKVNGLFGRFDHHIAFPEDWNFVIVHGVNGVGKTKVLDIVKSTLSGNVGRLSRLPFSTATLTLSDGTRIQVKRTRIESRSEVLDLFETPMIDRGHIEITVRRGKGKPVTFDFAPDALPIDPRLRNELEHLTPLIPLDEDTFLDRSTGETITSYEAMERYGNRLQRFRRPGGPGAKSAPPVLRRIWDSTNIHLIETQRLLREETPTPGRRQPDRQIERTSTVMKFSTDIVGRIQRTLSQLATKSQELDRTFPGRLVNTAPTSDNPEVSEEAIRSRYEEQMKLRRRLANIAVLDTFGTDVPLPKQIDPVVLRVMVEYLKDSEAKFRVVEPLLDRLELLTRILNDKFQYKKLIVDRADGFMVRTDDGTRIKPDQLSSGEQHELVLLYDLLFAANDGALVLIDEPEISLHVNWQKKFLKDLQEISAITGHRFIVATHSPQIVGPHRERLVRLDGKDPKSVEDS